MSTTPTKPHRKPYHPSSTLDKLTAPQLAQLKEWLLSENITYVAACKKIKATLGVVISPTTLHNWYHRTLAPDAARKVYFPPSTLDALTGAQINELKLWL